LGVVLFGGGNLTTEEMKQLEHLGMDSRIQHVTGDDTILASLYESTVALVYPSLYEGFGIPPLEAMRYKCPVIASNRASLPEVCGKDIIYIDPTSEESLQNALLKLLSNQSGYVKELAFQHSLTYSWKKTAMATLSLYERILESL
jgi:glycosyltransferase involved in cell wall biosynthesis